MMSNDRLARGPPRNAWASNTRPVAEANAPESSATLKAEDELLRIGKGKRKLTKLDLGGLVAVERLGPRVHAYQCN
jgi:hypothetical protein